MSRTQLDRIEALLHQLVNTLGTVALDTSDIDDLAEKLRVIDTRLDNIEDAVGVGGQVGGSSGADDGAQADDQVQGGSNDE